MKVVKDEKEIRERYREDKTGTACIVGFGGELSLVQVGPHKVNICCPRDCVSRHNGGTSGSPLKPDSALRALSTLRGLRGAPEVPPLCRETQSLGQQMLNATCVSQPSCTRVSSLCLGLT